MHPDAPPKSSARRTAHLLLAFTLLVASLGPAQAHVGMAAFSRVLIVGDLVHLSMTIPADHVSARTDLPGDLAQFALASTLVMRGGTVCPGQVVATESRRDSDVLLLAFTFSCEAQGRVELKLSALASLAGAGLQYIEVHSDGRREGFLRTSNAAVSFEAERLGKPSLVLSYLVLGAEHVLLGLDHFAFLLALWLSARTLGRALVLATIFTLGHSVTLALGALGLVQVPAGFVEPAIALSIAAAAFEGLLQGPLILKAAVAGCFGLVHGFGFANGLREAGLPEGYEVTALVAFTTGLEAAQVGLLLGAAPLLRRAATSSRLPKVIGAALAALGIGWFALRIAG